jgi:hypothetical protein
VVSAVHDLGSHYVAFVPDSSNPRIGSEFVPRCTNDQNEVVFANRPFHELRKLVARSERPIVESNVDTVAPQARGEIANPPAMAWRIPRVRDECSRCHRRIVYLVGLTDFTLSFAAGTHMPKPERHGRCRTVPKLMSGAAVADEKLRATTAELQPP